MSDQRPRIVYDPEHGVQAFGEHGERIDVPALDSPEMHQLLADLEDGADRIIEQLRAQDGRALDADRDQEAQTR